MSWAFRIPHSAFRTPAGFSSSLKPQALSVVFIVLLAALPAAAQTFYTENWSSLNSNWTVVAGSPVANGGFLRNATANGIATRLLYSGSLAIQDYSVQSALYCESAPDPNYDPAYYHYLRVSGGNYYLVTASWSGSMVITLSRVAASGGAWALGQSTGPCGTLKSSIQGSTITVSMNGTTIISATDTNYASGGLGVGTRDVPDYGSGIGQTVLAYADNQPPTVPTGLTAVPYSTRVNLSWNASTDNVGVTGYKIYRNSTYVGSSSTTSYTDVTVDPLTAYTYTVSAYDGGGNESAQSTPLPVTTLPLAYSAPEAGGPIEYAATWGAGAEKIAVLTGALALRLPLFKLQHRTRGPGFQMMASWNSQFWSWDAAGAKMVAMDTGYGLGWNFTLGGIYPVYSGNELVRFEFQDAAGVIHKLPPTATPNQYRSNDSTYLLWDNVARTLTFTDGTVWTFDCVSRWPEPDAGTRYPTRLRDTNGNLIDMVYEPASGMTGTNSSARIRTITDTISTLTWTYTTINGAPHVTLVRRSGAQTGVDDATFTYVTRTDIVSPFSAPLTGQPLTRVVLTEIKFSGTPGPFKFEYNTSAEITKLTVPHKGYFRYSYVTASFSNGARQVREISARFMAADGSAASEQAYSFTHPTADSALPGHSSTNLWDAAGNALVWYFYQNSANGWDNGLNYRQITYQGPSPNYVPKQDSVFFWTQDNPASQSLTNPRMAAVETVPEDLTTRSKREQDVDSNGNVTQVREYAYGSGAPGPLYRTTSTTYLNNANYTSRNILNRPAQITVCAGAAGCATPASSTTITYDGGSIGAVEGITQHDSLYGPTFLYRGNPYQVNANGLTTTANYDEGGNVLNSSGPRGVVFNTYDSTASKLVSASGGGNTTSFTWNADTTLNSATGSNTDTVNFTYSSYRPTQVRRPDGTLVNISYSDTTYPLSQTESTPLGAQKTTYFDGFGRAIKTAAKENDTTWTYTETQYSACSCSSTGKAVKVSRPYRSGTPVWTETRYDALGRPTEMILPDGNRTTYTYSVENNATWKGILTLITDPAGKRKRYLHDAFGRLLRVDEPDVAGALVETARYTYDVLGRLTKTEMGRNVPQPQNLSFESGVSPWLSWGSVPAQTSAQAKVGSFSVQQAGGSGSGTYQDLSGLAPGQTYRVRAWVLGSVGNALTVQLWLHDTTGANQQLVTLVNPPSNGWSLLEADFVATSTAAMRIHLLTYYSGTAWWDYVTISGVSAGSGSVKQTRTFNYNTAGQLTSATNPENGTVSYTYFGDGLPQSKTDAKNQTLWFVYDNNRRLLRIESPQGTVKTSFTYDSNATVPASYAQGRMTSASNDGYTWHYSYDIMGRVQKQTLETAIPQVPGYPNPRLSAQAQYAYDQDGRVTDLYYPGALRAPASVAPGTRYRYTYDLPGRPLTLAYTLDGISWNTVAQSAQYNAAGQLTSWQEIYGAAVFNPTRSYSDLRGWVTQMTSPGFNISYSYLANGRVSAANDSANPGQSATYEYDQLNRLTKATTPNWALQWTYDEFGNRLTQTKVPGSAGTPPEITLSYNESTNRLTTAGYSYDANGNTALPGIGLAYDVFDRVITMNTASTTTSASYDAFGRRIERRVGTARKIFFYDMGGRLLAEYDNPVDGGGSSRTLQYFASQRLYHYTDRTGNVRYSYTMGASRHFYPFGEEITGTASDAYKFADLYRDADTGLDYAMARYHSSTTARFLTADRHKGSSRLNMPQSFNRYAYALNDPANLSDPSGLIENVPPGCVTSSDGHGYTCPGGGGGGGDTGVEEMEAVNEETGGGGGGGGADPDPTGLLTGSQIGLDALRNREECKNLFREPSNPEDDFDPAALLQSLINGGPSGRISFADLGGPVGNRVTAARTVPNVIQNEQGLRVVSGWNIQINSNLAGPWFRGYADRFDISATFGAGTQNIYRAITLLHELGHVVRYIRGGVAGLDPEREGDHAASLRNTELVFNSCFR